MDALACHADGTIFASGGDDRFIKVFDVFFVVVIDVVVVVAADVALVLIVAAFFVVFALVFRIMSLSGREYFYKCIRCTSGAT